MRCILGIEIIVLAATAPIDFVRCRDLQYFNADALHEAEQAGTVAASRFNADALDYTDRIQASICRYP